ncbi:sensor histidine kinase [Paenibacillus sp. FSL H8-0034]|uniref:sensor histidine kinase n=1 Tax=Paenibacillus sp. FSL H8-0034 TaxID=2954671 RepID=UPI0030FB1505
MAKHRYFMPMHMKFFIFFILLITVPYCISGVFTYHKYSSDVDRNTRDSTLKIMEQMNLNLDRYVKEIDRLTQAPLYDQGLLGILSNHGGSYDPNLYLSVEEHGKVNLFLSSFTSERTEIKGIMIFTNDGGIFSSTVNSIKSYWNTAHNDWMADVEKRGGGLEIVPPHTANYYLQPLKVVSLSRVIIHPETKVPLGIIKVDLTMEGFQRVLSLVDFTPNSRFFVYNRDEVLLYPFELSDQPERSFAQVTHDAPDTIVSTVFSNYSKLSLVGHIPLDDLRRDAQELTTFTIIISIISLIAAYGVAMIISNRLVKPIRHLQSRMKLVQSGAFQVKAAVVTHDEIGQLTVAFNNMVDELNRLVREVYETQIREREAELFTLQSQINPHFLYNTLETVNMLALHNQQLQISDIVTSLGKLLRYTVAKMERPVTLKDELLFVDHYLQIQSFRLKNRLHAVIDIEPSYEDCLVPKLILQPLIENVIEHALKKDTVTILLTAYFNNDDLFIKVNDDGVGMSEQQIQQVEQQINSKHPVEHERDQFGLVRKGFGLRNVNQRLKILYGDSYGLFIGKDVKAGSSFVLKIPV